MNVVAISLAGCWGTLGDMWFKSSLGCLALRCTGDALLFTADFLLGIPGDSSALLTCGGWISLSWTVGAAVLGSMVLLSLTSIFILDFASLPSEAVEEEMICLLVLVDFCSFLVFFSSGLE